MGRILAAVAAALLLAGCGSDGADTAASTTTTTTTTTIDQAAAIANWNDRLDPVLSDLSDAFGWIGGAMSNEDLRDARAACRELSATADDLERLKPGPAPGVDAHLSAAVEGFRKYARRCQTINPRWTAPDFAELQGFHDQGMEHMQAVVDVVTGKP